MYQSNSHGNIHSFQVLNYRKLDYPDPSDKFYDSFNQFSAQVEKSFAMKLPPRSREKVSSGSQTNGAEAILNYANHLPEEYFSKLEEYFSLPRLPPLLSFTI
jgi:hypothetical protein